MRYFLLIFVLSVVTVLGLAGKRGSLSRKPPIELFPDMDRQPKLRPQEPNSFVPNGQSSQPLVPGTIARGTPYEDNPVNTGHLPGVTNLVETIPLPVTAQLMARGKERYAISCVPCHGPQADGNGITKKYGMAVVANLHDPRIVKMADGEIFSIITQGKNLMGAYGATIAIPDRWAIIAYLRALQLSKVATMNDVPAELRSTLKK